MCWNKGRLCWKTAKLLYFCHLRKLVRSETFGPYYVQCQKGKERQDFHTFILLNKDRLKIMWYLPLTLKSSSSCKVLNFCLRKYYYYYYYYYLFVTQLAATSLFAKVLFSKAPSLCQCQGTSKPPPSPTLAASKHKHCQRPFSKTLYKLFTAAERRTTDRPNCTFS